MPKKIKILFAFIFLQTIAVFSQTVEENNLARYWKYRERFSKYFIYRGFQNGEGHVVCIRNRANPKNSREMLPNLGFGQHGIHFGYYLGMLSTEYLLLKTYHQPQAADNTLNELCSALKAYTEQMEKCENQWNKEKIVDGFFIRENVPPDFLADTSPYGLAHKLHFNQGLVRENVWDTAQNTIAGVPAGHPGWAETVDVRALNNKEPMSQDEAYGLMMGLALVVRCVPELKDDAADLFEKITLHIINKNPNYRCSAIGYYIYKPDCQKVSESSGGSTGALAYGIAAAAAKTTGKEIAYFMNMYNNKRVKSEGTKPYNRKFYDRLVKKGNVKFLWNVMSRGVPGNQEWNRSMVATLAAMGDSWYPRTSKGIENNALHKKGKTVSHDWRSFYLTLWRFLHNYEGVSAEKILIENELANAPWEGPYNFVNAKDTSNHAKGGWAHEYRYRATISEQYSGTGHKGVFNGLDYMLMYNLYRLVYVSSDPTIAPYLCPKTAKYGE
ncbi:MAG: hypothetical protein FWH36_07255 [Lentimicrobiaceae bacterium]|nr:hypothetical protein [Lentimicrobiaceae bacterium]